jgi:hypothetical protein
MGLGFLQLILIPVALIALGYQVFMYFKDGGSGAKGMDASNELDPLFPRELQDNGTVKPLESAFDNTFDHLDLSNVRSFDDF